MRSPEALAQRAGLQEFQWDKVDETGASYLSAANELFCCSALNEGALLTGEGVVNDPRAVDRLRILRAKIERRNLGQRRFGCLAITSALPQEGKSVIAVNLSRVFGLDPLGKTLLIDCDLRKPTVHRFFQVDSAPGVSDAILGKFPLRQVVRSVDTGMDVITAGSESYDPTQVLDQPAFAEELKSLREEYRYVFLDLPPVLLCPEPIMLSSVADTTLMVVRAWETERAVVRDAVEALGRQKILGFVLNGGTESSRQYSYYSHYGYYRGGLQPPPDYTKRGLLGFLSRCYPFRK